MASSNTGAPAPLLTVDVGFSAAHRLEHDNGPCRGLHGHNYRLRVTARREMGGRAADTSALQNLVRERVWRSLDHSLLNDRLSDPTAERVAAWIWTELAEVAPTLIEVSLAEAPDRMVTLRNERSR